MKKILFVVALTITMTAGYAQQGEIIYLDFEPDTCKYVTEIDSLEIDIDQDGQIDVRFSGYCQHGALLMTTHVSQGWEQCNPYPLENTLLNSDSLHWQSYWDDWFGSGTFMGRIGLRKVIGDQYCYGWMQVYCDTVPTHPYPGAVGRNTYVDRMAFCDIPNYPLVWGQTKILGFEETAQTSFATLHPNPTNSLVTITGENLRQAEVINTLGQRMLSVQGEGNELHIDMAAPPAGVYFVTITDEEGRKCVRKILKE